MLVKALASRSSTFSPGFALLAWIKALLVFVIASIVYGTMPKVRTAAVEYQIVAFRGKNLWKALPERADHARYAKADAITAATGGFCAFPASKFWRHCFASVRAETPPSSAERWSAGIEISDRVAMLPKRVEVRQEGAEHGKRSLPRTWILSKNLIEVQDRARTRGDECAYLRATSHLTPQRFAPL